MLQERRRHVPEVAGALDIRAADRRARARRLQDAYELSLEEALALAATASRDYLREREAVYLTTLNLTGVRRRFEAKYGLAFGLGARLDNDDLRPEGNLGASLDQESERGGRVVIDLATGFLAGLLTGDPFDAARSVLSTDILIPIGRGSGWVAREPLTQAERDVLYALRAFARFQQEFTVSIATEYYRLLQDRDTLKNEELTLESLQRLLDRQEALGREGAGRLPDFEVDQTRQNVLVAENRVISARTRFESALDEFKLTLGIPVDREVRLEEAELEALRDRGLEPLPLDAATGIRIALDRRLDLRNALDEHEDDLRKLMVARDAMGWEANIVLSGLVRRNEGVRSLFRNLESEAFAGLDVDLPLERMDERNALVNASVVAARSRRGAEALQDRIKQQVRGAARQLLRAEKSYEIQVEGVKLAERRVDSTDQLLEAGRASTRDRLDAETSLVTARNALTGALVDHALARLVLLRDAGVLEIGGDGTWTEPLFRPDGSLVETLPVLPDSGPRATAPPRAGAPAR
jgi:outer membrane protein TolC